MKSIKNMSHAELAAYIQNVLQREEIKVVLSGGSAVSFYSNNRYVSKDLDLININFSRRSKIKAAMEKIDFQEKGRYFINRDTDFLVEFPEGPLSVGEEPVKEISEFKLATGTLRVLSATDCVHFIFGRTSKGWPRLSWSLKAKVWIYRMSGVGQLGKVRKKSIKSSGRNLLSK